MLGIVLYWSGRIVIAGMIAVVLSIVMEPGEAIVIGTVVLGLIEGMK